MDKMNKTTVVDIETSKGACTLHEGFSSKSRISVKWQILKIYANSPLKTIRSMSGVFKCLIRPFFLAKWPLLVACVLFFGCRCRPCKLQKHTNKTEWMADSVGSSVLATNRRKHSAVFTTKLKMKSKNTIETVISLYHCTLVFPHHTKHEMIEFDLCS